MDPFDLYFATLVGWTYHPGYNRDDTHKPTLQECAHLARQMVKYSEANKTQT